MFFNIDMCAETVMNRKAGWTECHKVHKCVPQTTGFLLAAIGICLYGGMCQIRWLSHTLGLCLYGGMCQSCWLLQVSVYMEVCVRYIVWGGVIYVQVYRQKVKAVRAWEWSDGYTSPITLW